MRDDRGGGISRVERSPSEPYNADADSLLDTGALSEVLP
jgi:hypothetical protein